MLATTNASEAIAPQDAEFFERKIRPILAENCFSCHGPKKQMSGLRLDSLESLRQGGDNGPVAFPGDPEHSPLILAIRRQGKLKMPPKTPLKPWQIDDLAVWVKRGLPWPTEKPTANGPAVKAWQRHWAFQPVGNPPLPPVKNERWPRTTVDHFVLAELEKKGLAPSPSPAADRRTLIRRVTFDLIGLPPTPEQIDAFEADSSPTAYARVVDRLLASPHYGERWGRYWLDVARYADNKGYVFFQDSTYPWSYTYRDYVIRSFNEDLPYDRFIREQLAADRLPLGDDKRALTALGFLSLGGRFMNNQQDIVDDRIDVVTRGLLGLTVTCARCHDHKFDPIPTKDYYSLYGVFASTVEPAVPPLFESPPKTEIYVKFEKELKVREAKLGEFVRSKHNELITGARTRMAEYMLAAHAASQHPNTEEFMLLADGGDLNPKMLLRWQVYLDRTRKSHHPVFALWNTYRDLPEKDFPAKAQAVAVGQNDSNRLNPLIEQAFAGKPPKSVTEAAQRYSDVLNRVDKKWQEAVKKAAAEKKPLHALPDPAEEALRQVFYGPDAPPDIPMNPIGDLALLPDRASQAKLQEFLKAVEKWRIEGPGAPPRAMILEDTPTPVQPRVFLRGNPNNLGDSVPRHFLGALAGKQRRPFQDGGGRLDLARAIVDRRNPLTARVLVNRVWMGHFGNPLVATPSDFGLRSSPPTHPALLDHLATLFMDGGWSIKTLHRQIVLSATYQQVSSECQDLALSTQHSAAVDPDNALVSRMNRRRLDLEALRDSLLAVSGGLDQRIGGAPFKELMDPRISRRTIYSFVDRLNLPGIYRTFDFPSPDATSPKRDSTTVAPQALFLMNHPFVQEAARRLLQRPELAAEPSGNNRVRILHRLLYGREPTAEEQTLAQEFTWNSGNVSSPWELYAQALLLANEFAFVD